MKKVGPPLTLTPPPVDDCADCNKQGKTKPMLYDLLCFTCGGAGFVEKDTGRLLEFHEACFVFHERAKQKNALLQHLKRQLPENEHDPYKGMTDNFRMD
ncbi:MAG: hypothetical protein V7731_01770 [Amphritea sp.]